MRASVLAIGSELLRGFTRDTNSEYIVSKLKELGYEIVLNCRVDDDPDAISGCVSRSIELSDLVVITGGLGPTRDDLTREAVSHALGKRLVFDERMFENVVSKLSGRLSRIPESIRKEAMLVEGGEFVENDVGSAPGQIVEVDGKTVVMLPGPPAEMRNVFEKVLEKIPKGEGVVVKTLKFYNVRESILEDELKRILYSNEAVKVATQASYTDGVFLRFEAREGDSDVLGGVVEEVRKLRWRDIYAEDDGTMEETVVGLLSKLGLSLSVSESCTGGMLASTLVNVPGVSRVFKGGIIAYDNSVKVDVLGVREGTLKRHGAVSEQCVLEMAEGVSELMKSDVSISISGVAGPSGGTEDKPVGTVYIDVFGPWGHEIGRFDFGYVKGRNAIRRKSVMTSLDVLRRKLLDWRDRYDER